MNKEMIETDIINRKTSYSQLNTEFVTLKQFYNKATTPGTMSRAISQNKLMSNRSITPLLKDDSAYSDLNKEDVFKNLTYSKQFKKLEKSASLNKQQLFTP